MEDEDDVQNRQFADGRTPRRLPVPALTSFIGWKVVPAESKEYVVSSGGKRARNLRKLPLGTFKSVKGRISF